MVKVHKDLVAILAVVEQHLLISAAACQEVPPFWILVLLGGRRLHESARAWSHCARVG